MRNDLLILLLITLSLSIGGVIIAYLILFLKRSRKNYKRIIKFTSKG